MNVCMFFNRAVTRLGHATILEIQKRSGGDGIFCGYISGRDPYFFLRDQVDIKYKTLLTDDILSVEAGNEVVDEDFLDRKEKEYGTPFFWHFFTVDRAMINRWPHTFYTKYEPIFDHYQVKQQLQYRIKTIEKMFDECKPDMIMLTSACTMGSLLLYYIGRSRGIRCVVLMDTRLGDAQIFSESIYNKFTTVAEKWLLLQTGNYISPKLKEAEAWIESYREKPVKPYWTIGLESPPLTHPVLLLKNLVRKILDSFNYGFPTIYAYTWTTYVKRNFLLWLNQYRHPRYDIFDPKESYVYFPLHFEPELSLMLWAPYYTDQINVIFNIAQSLPINFKLYIKEHPAMLTSRDREFYKKLKSIPNVRLIRPGLDSIDIIKRAKIVMTVTGTAAWEAVLLKVPTIIFGATYFDILSGVKRCKIPEDLPNLVNECLHYDGQNEINKERDLQNLVALVMEDMFDIDISKLWSILKIEDIRENSDFKTYVEEMLKFYNKISKNDLKNQLDKTSTSDSKNGN